MLGVTVDVATRAGTGVELLAGGASDGKLRTFAVGELANGPKWVPPANPTATMRAAAAPPIARGDSASRLQESRDSGVLRFRVLPAAALGDDSLVIHSLPLQRRRPSGAIAGCHSDPSQNCEPSLESNPTVAETASWRVGSEVAGAGGEAVSTSIHSSPFQRSPSPSITAGRQRSPSQKFAPSDDSAPTAGLCASVVWSCISPHAGRHAPSSEMLGAHR